MNSGREEWINQIIETANKLIRERRAQFVEWIVRCVNETEEIPQYLWKMPMPRLPKREEGPTPPDVVPIWREERPATRIIHQGLIDPLNPDRVAGEVASAVGDREEQAVVDSLLGHVGVKVPAKQAVTGDDIKKAWQRLKDEGYDCDTVLLNPLDNEELRRTGQIRPVSERGRPRFSGTVLGVWSAYWTYAIPGGKALVYSKGEIKVKVRPLKALPPKEDEYAVEEYLLCAPEDDKAIAIVEAV